MSHTRTFIPAPPPGVHVDRDSHRDSAGDMAPAQHTCIARAQDTDLARAFSQSGLMVAAACPPPIPLKQDAYTLEHPHHHHASTPIR